MKKQNKKNNHAGRNIFGQKCITKEVILNKENALEQYLEVLNDIEQHRQLGINIEYDVKMPSAIELGNVGVSFDVVFRLCEVLDISPKELFDFRD